MTKLTRFFGTCVLVVSLSGVALAGDVMTPPVAPPPPFGSSSNCPGTEAPALQQPGQDLSGDLVTAMDTLASWLVASIQ
jgi:hypothetical protein